MTVELRDLGLKGEVITPEDARYDAARALFAGHLDPRPAAIARVADDDDVARVIGRARETGAELSVRSGGHGLVGHSDGGIVIDLRDRRRVDVDAAAATAWAETGATASEFTRAADAVGLGVGFGDTGSVGLGGLATGGGVGYLVRRHGLTIDSLIAADVVTADGNVHRVDAEREPDLFWAIRGGGGNFGVVTRVQLRLHRVDPFYGGLLVQPASAASLHEFITLADAAPLELSLIANVMPCPPMPFVPAEHHGKIVVLSFIAFLGDAAAGERVLAPFRALAAPLADTVKAMPYAQIYPPEDPSYRPIAKARTLMVDAFDRASADAVMEHLRSSNATFSACQIRPLGGAAARVPDEATAYAHRTRRFMVNIAAMVERAGDLPLHDGWLEAFARDVQRGPVGAYVNFLGDEGPARVRDAYPGRTYERLSRLKARYDPANLFHCNQNITPLR